MIIVKFVESLKYINCDNIILEESEERKVLRADLVKEIDELDSNKTFIMMNLV
jgi:hypothetical protein